MKRLTQGVIALGALALSAAAAVALQDENAAAPTPLEAPAEEPAVTEVGETPAAPKATTPRRSAQSAPAGRETPMAERVATVGLLNKRNGLWRDLKLRPGQATRVGDVIVRLRACERTAPWEPQTMTGAFVQVDVQGSDERWRRAFSGWLFKESPSLNVVEHPIYDVWAKDCAMTHPEIGAGTTALPAPGTRGASSRSSAPKSAPSPAASAQSNSDT